MKPETSNYVYSSVRFHRSIYTAILIILALLWYGCANIVPPEGGKKDETPPVLLSINPADSAINSRPSKITLHFNKFMEIRDLEKNLSLSPLLSIAPTIISYGKRVEITILDTQLTHNTTYRIGLGNAITDNREGNPYKNFEYVFSTGAYFDSLELHGKIIDAATGLPDTAGLITLYAFGDNDTAVIRKKPQYASKADGSGNFSFRSLPYKAFKMYAIQDANNNYIYDYGEEKIGFLDSLVLPSLSKDISSVFFMFKEIIDTTSSLGKEQAVQDSALHVDRSNSITSGGKSGRISRTEKPPRNNTGYRVNADTSNIIQRTFELNGELTIDVFTTLKSLDTAKIYLSYENEGIEVESLRKLIIDSSIIKIRSEWQGNKKYTLRLVKGWAKDTSGAELPPGKYAFRTKGDEDYGTLRLHLSKAYYGDTMVLFVYKGNDSVYCKPVTDTIVTIPRLQPGEYGMRIIVDANRNGKWDAGILLKQVQPEKVIPYNGSVVLKAGWENELDFTPANTRPKAARAKEEEWKGTRDKKEKDLR